MSPPGAPHGYGEACRVLAHSFRDKPKAPDEAVPEPRNWSRFLQKACEEAIEALEHHMHVKDLKSNTSSWKDWSAYPPAPPAPPGPGDDSKGVGKGNGKVLQEGPR